MTSSGFDEQIYEFLAIIDVFTKWVLKNEV